MSFILDALKKVQKERDAKAADSEVEAAAAESAARADTPGDDAGGAGKDRKRLILIGAGAGTALLLSSAAAVWVFFPGLLPWGADAPPPKVAEVVPGEGAPEEKAMDAGVTAPAEEGAVAPEKAVAETVAAPVTEVVAPPSDVPAPNPFVLPSLIPSLSIKRTSPGAAVLPDPTEVETQPADTVPEAPTEPPVLAPPPPVVEPTPVRKPEPPPPSQRRPHVREAAAPGTAAAMIQEAFNHEQEGRYDLAVARYSRAIRMDRSSAAAYFGRAWTLLEMDRTDQAIGDFTRAIKYAPSSPDGYLGRALAYERKGRLGASATDYGKLLQVAPGRPEHILGRGVVSFQRQFFGSALQDFEDAARTAGPVLKRYAVLWEYVARLRGGQRDAASALSSGVRGLDLSPWPGVLARHFIGQASEDMVMAVVGAGNATQRKTRLCVTHFFLGQVKLAAGEAAKAEEHFRQAVDTGARSFRQYWAARVELGRLERTR